MVFDSRATFEPGTGRAILWADTPVGTRFQVAIDPQYAIDLWGLRRPVEPSEFASAIQERMDEITKVAQFVDCADRVDAPRRVENRNDLGRSTRGCVRSPSRGLPP